MSNYLDLEELALELDTLREVDTEIDPLDEDDIAKLDELKAIEDQLGDLHVYARKMDSALIPEDEFEEYVQDQAEQNGDIAKGAAGSYLVIDWEATAENVKSCDYLEVEYDGNTYFIRG